MSNREEYEDVVFYVGPTAETTPVQGSKTLSVNGVRSVQQMIDLAKEHKCSHIRLGANESFQKNKLWNKIIPKLLDEKFKVTLEYPITAHDFVSEMLDTEVLQHVNFIPVVSCKLSNIETFSKNLIIKIDDVGFDETNRGVWCLTPRELLDRNRFTPWVEYDNDIVILRDSDLQSTKSKVKV